MHVTRKNLLRRAVALSTRKIAARSSRQRCSEPLIQGLETRLMMSTYNVNTLADNTTPGGSLTLREAIALANAHPNSTIILDKTGTYNLTDSAVDGDTDLDITAPMTIESLSGKATNTYINGNYTGGVFDIANPNMISNVTIDNVTIQNGLVNGDGAGIFLADDTCCTLTLNGDLICNNNANGQGGGVYAGVDNTVYISGTIFQDNISSGNGGGLDYLGPSLTVYKSTFTGNQSGNNGGGIFMEDETFSSNPSLKMAYDSFMNNTSEFFGGGVFFAEPQEAQPQVNTLVSPIVLPLATVKLVSMCFTNNSSGYEGGGMYVIEGDTEMNFAVSPSIDAGVPISLTISESQFTNNFGSSGGGVFCDDVDSVSIDTTSFTNNKGDYSGGGLTVVDDDNQIDGLNSDVDAGLDNPNNSVKITYSTFTGNASSSGGGIFIADAASVTIDHSTVSSNRATYDGGGIYYEADRDNQDPDHSVAFTLTNDVINGNTVGGGRDDGGGGVFLDVEGSTAAVQVTITNTKVTNNKMGGGGGGLFLSDDDDTEPFMVTMSLDTISGNTSTGFTDESGEGGGAYIESPANTANQTTITKSTFASNRATYEGGGLYLDQGDGETDITADTFNNNDAAANGGGIATGSTAGVVNLTNDTLASNAAASDGGGLYTDTSTSINLTYDTIALNTAALGGGVYNYTAMVEVLDTIIATNLATGMPSNGPDVYGAFVDEGHNLIGESDGSTGFTVSTLVGTSTNKKNPALKPLGFYGGPTETMAILNGSLPDDKGITVPGITTDQRGVARTATPAIGSYEV